MGKIRHACRAICIFYSRTLVFNRLMIRLGLKQVRSSSTVATIDNLSKFQANSRIFSLIQPTGKVHLGNYLGALRNWKQISEQAPQEVELIFGTADLHSVTALPNSEVLRENRAGAIASILSCGLDTKRCIVFHQLSVPEHTELYWILTCLTSMGALNRMTQWKLKASLDDKLDIFNENAMGKTKAGILLYPVLQAADVLLYNSTHVPVGDDQSQHLELCRGIASTFNHTYGQFFNVPKTILTPLKKILLLRNPEKKMSKSDTDTNAAVYVTDDPDTIARKFRKAVTDSVQGPVVFDPENRPGVSNLLTIISGIQNKSMAQAEHDVAWMTSHKQLKDYVTDVVVEEFWEKRKLYEALMADRSYLELVCREGADRARAIASTNLEQIKQLVGLN